MKTYFMKFKGMSTVLIARHNKEAMQLADAFGITLDKGITSLIDEDGNIII